MSSFFNSLFHALFESRSAGRGQPKTRGDAATTGMKGLEVFEEQDDGTVMFELNGAFYPSKRFSSNRKFLVGASDGNDAGGRTKSGRLVLIDLKRKDMIFRKSLKRAENPWVSDEGLWSRWRTG